MVGGGGDHDLIPHQEIHTVFDPNRRRGYQRQGTAVNHFQAGDTSVQFSVEGEKDAQITIQLEDEREYEVYVDGVSVGGMKTNVSGKLVLSVELNPGKATAIRIEAR